MNHKVVFGCLLFFALCDVVAGSAPEYRLGGSLVYNFKTRGFGLEGRAEFPLKNINLLEGISIVPQLAYFPSAYDASEIDLGSSVHLAFYRLNKWIFYGLVNVSYRGWFNLEEADIPDTRYRDWAIETGIGITRKTCVRPFMELRLNFFGVEPNVRVGLLYTINCDRRGMVPCSKIPPEPQF